MSATVILVCSGDPTPPVQAAVGRYALWFQRAAPAVVFGFADLREPDAELPAADAYVFMGSPNAVYDPHPWRPRALEAARQALDSGAPALGVCFGHQLFCEALGGRVARNERVEVGTIEVALDPAAAADPLLTPESGVSYSPADTVLHVHDLDEKIESDEQASKHHHRRAPYWLKKVAPWLPWCRDF